MLDFSRLQPQFSDFGRYRIDEQDRQARRLEQALQAFDDCRPVWEMVRDHINHQRPTFLVPELLEDPGRVTDSTSRPTPITVVATDGSQVYPDRHVDPPCYLLNVSRIAFQYGTLERPVMEATPELRYRQRDLEHVLENLVESLSANIVSAIRDVEELKTLRKTVQEARVPGRPVVAVADGTLIRWMLNSLNRPALEQKMIGEYVAELGHFQAQQWPLCSYISRPGNTEVVNLLRVFCGETDATPEEHSLSGLRDWQLFEHVLAEGQRSAVFKSRSRIQKAYGEHNEICYMYLRIPTRFSSEIARVEFPEWMAREAGLLDLIQAVLLDQAEKGRGYPVVLAEAHEQAVIRSGEKELFYRLLERHMQALGVYSAGTRKQASKDVPLV